MKPETGPALSQIKNAKKRIGVLLKKQEYGKSLPYILSLAPQLYAANNLSLLEGWNACLPDDLKQRTPWLAYWRALALLPSNPQESRRLLEETLKIFEVQGDRNGCLLSVSAIINTILLEHDDFKNFDPWIDWIDSHVDSRDTLLSPETEAWIASAMTCALTWRNPWRPDRKTWADRTNQALKLVQDPLARQSALGHLLDYFIHLGSSKEIGTCAKKLVQSTSLSPPPPLAHLASQYRMAQIHLALSSHTLHFAAFEGATLPTENVAPIYHAVSCINQVIMAFQDENFDRVLHFLAPLEEMDFSDKKITGSQYHCLYALYYVRKKDLLTARRHADHSVKMALHGGALFVEAYAGIILAGILRRLGERSAAWAQLGRTKKAVEPLGNTHALFLVRLTEASLLLDEEDKPSARKALRDVFHMGREMGHANLSLYWFWQPGEMARLCMEALSADIESAYAKKLITLHNLIPDAPVETLRNWPWAYSIRTLGKLEIENEGRLLTIQKRPLSLLKTLIALGGKDVQEVTIEDLLWPGAEGDKARIALRTTISRLRALLGNERIVEVRAEKVSLNARHVWLDTWALESLSERVLSLQRKERQTWRGQAEHIHDLSVILSELYAGDFLDKEIEPWIESSRRRFRSHFTGTVERLGRMLDYCGESEKAAALYGLAAFKGAVPLKTEERQQRTDGSFHQQQNNWDQTASPKMLRAPERKPITLLCAGIIHERPSPDGINHEAIPELVTESLSLLGAEITKHGGTMTGLMGNRVIGLFGAPIGYEDHPHRACRVALSMLAAMQEFAPLLKQKYGIDAQLRIGIDSGLVLFASAGAVFGAEYSVVGDTPKSASFLETTALPQSILVSRNTYLMAQDFFEFEEADNICLTENQMPSPIYRLCGAKEMTSRIKAAEARGLTHFVGRRTELSLLWRALEKAESGLGQAVAIMGDAGVGKSRLLLEFQKNLPPRKYTCLEGQCQKVESSAAYLPVSELLRSYFLINEKMAETEAKRLITDKLNEVAPRLSGSRFCFYELFSMHVENNSFESLDPKLRREKTFEAILNLFFAVARIKPLILVIEDLHWIDETSQELLVRLVKAIANKPILLLLAYRPEYDIAWENHAYLQHLSLKELEEHEMTTLMKSLLPRTEIKASDKDWIIKRAAGNPLFLEELLRAMKNRNYLTDTPGGVLTVEGAARTELPDTLLGIIGARIDNMSDDIELVLQNAAVIGVEFSYTVINKVLGSEGLEGQLQRLQDLEIIYRKTTFGPREYAFKHALVQEAIYTKLPFTSKRRMHKEIAESISALCTDRLEEVYEKLSYHYGKSDNTLKAYEFSKLAGVKAVKRSALWEAFRFFCEAREVIERQPPMENKTAKRMEMALLITFPMMSLGFPQGSLDILLEGEKASREAHNAKNLTNICGVIGLYYSVRGDTLLGLQHSEASYKEAIKSNDIEVIAPTAFDLASNYAARGDFPKLIKLAPYVAKLIEQSGREHESFDRGYNIYSGLLTFHGFAAAHMGDFAAGVRLCEKALQVALRTGNLYSIGMAEVLYGYALCHQGNGKAALPHFEQAVRHLEKGEIFILLGLAVTGIGYSQFFEGELEKALENVEKGLAIHRQAGVTYNLSLHHLVLCMILTELNRLEDAEAHAEMALEIANRSNEIYNQGLSMVVKGGLLFLKAPAHMDEARSMTTKGLAILEKLKSKPNCAIAHLILTPITAGTDRPQAIKHLRTAQIIFQKSGMVYWTRKAELLEGMLSSSPQDTTLS